MLIVELPVVTHIIGASKIKNLDGTQNPIQWHDERHGFAKPLSRCKNNIAEVTVFDSMYEVKEEKALGLFCVKPVTSKGDPYMIIFASDLAAKNFCVQLAMGQVPSPTENPAKYQSKGIHPDGKTQLLALR